VTEHEGPITGRQLAHYRVIGRLGSGGMGEIYIAEDTRLERRVALKVLPSAAVSDAERLQRFRSEAKAVAALNHPNIVTVHGVEEDSGIHFIAMELVEGQTLRHIIPTGGLPLAQFFRIAEELTEAVAAAHDKGITHRDLKPDNVMVTESGHVKVLDFGLAKLVGEPPDRDFDGATIADSDRLPSVDLTEDGAVLGTIPYMSPEQAAGQPVDHRSDLFSLGILLYEILVGDRPFDGLNTSGIMKAILHEPAEPISKHRRDIPRAIELAIEHCLVKDPTQRLQSANSLLEQLRMLRREYSSPSGSAPPAVATTPTVVQAAAAPSSVWRQNVQRVQEIVAEHRVAIALLALVFVVNLVETAIETFARERWDVGRELGFRLARAAHFFEGGVTAEAYDAAPLFVVYSYSVIYFFITLVLLIATGWALVRRPGPAPFRVFGLAIAVDYAVSLPFFVFFPVPERWAYPESGAILLSDLWAPALIELFRPISGLDNCFPSFHVSLTVIMVALAFHYRLRFRWVALWLGVLIALSTLVLGIHWAIDIVAGLAAGILAVAAALLIERRIEWPVVST
jgi:serine/threonine protein kinase/membrane-associated phospholipid phosphatase